MASKFIRANVVIIAEAHNPSILSPDWLKRNEVITEDPNQFILTPDFAVFESKSFNLMVDRQRWQLNTKRVNPSSIESLSTIATKYFDLLPHIPYLKLGMNFDWLIEEDENGSPPKITPMIGSLTDLSSIFPNHNLC